MSYILILTDYKQFILSYITLTKLFVLISSSFNRTNNIVRERITSLI
jgi:hypothetical protein